MITFAYDDNVGSEDKRLSIACESPCFEWVIWGRVDDFAKVSAFIRHGGDYIKACESSGGKIYWSMNDGSLWILQADLESWDFGLRLSDDERRDLVQKIEMGPEK